MAEARIKYGNGMDIVKFSHIVWDFNGTLLDDVETGIKSANVLLGRRGLEKIESVEDYRKAFCFPITQYYSNIGLDLVRESFDDLANEWMEQYLYFSRDAKLYDGVDRMLEYVKSLGIPQIILSATEKTMLLSQLDEYGISGYFDEVVGRDDIRASSKEAVAREWARRTEPAAPLMIGDTVHDFDVSRAINAKCLLNARGHQSVAALKICGVPVFDGVGSLYDGLSKDNCYFENLLTK